MRLAFLIGVSVFLVAQAAVTPAALVFEGTGAEFAADPLASFPTVAPTASGAAIDFVTLTTNEILALYPLAEAGRFSGLADPIVISIQANLTRLSDDFDPVFLATDGSGAVGGQPGDNPGGSARAIEATLAGNAINLIDTPFIFDNAGFPAIGEDLDVDIEIILGLASTSIEVSFLSSSATATTMALNRDAELSFLLVSNSFIADSENYRLNSLRLEILPDIVPEPTSLSLTALALCCVFLRRRPTAR